MHATPINIAAPIEGDLARLIGIGGCAIEANCADDVMRAHECASTPFWSRSVRSAKRAALARTLRPAPVKAGTARN